MTSIEDLVELYGSRQAVWNHLFEYKEGLLFWKNPRAPRITPGMPAGNRNTRYFSVFVCGKTVYLHKIIFEMFNGDYSGEVDHKDTDTYNNLKENLRPATHQANTQNVGLRQDNSSGIKGVHFNKVTGKYVAQTTEVGKRKYLGSFNTAEEAGAAYVAAASILHGEFFRSCP